MTRQLFALCVVLFGVLAAVTATAAGAATTGIPAVTAVSITDGIMSFLSTAGIAGVFAMYQWRERISSQTELKAELKEQRDLEEKRRLQDRLESASEKKELVARIRTLEDTHSKAASESAARMAEVIAKNTTAFEAFERGFHDRPCQRAEAAREINDAAATMREAARDFTKATERIGSGRGD